MITFAIKTHAIRPGVQVVEIFDGRTMVGQFVPGDQPGEIRLLTKYGLATRTINAGGNEREPGDIKNPNVFSLQIIRK